MKIRVIHAEAGNWYHVGEEYEVRDSEKYSSVGVQVWNSGETKAHPDVIANGDFEYV